MPIPFYDACTLRNSRPSSHNNPRAEDGANGTPFALTANQARRCERRSIMAKVVELQRIKVFMRILSGIIILLAASLQLAQSQGTSATSESNGTGNVGSSSPLGSDVEAGGGASALALPSVFPIQLQKNLVTRISLSETYNSGLQTGGLQNASDIHTEASSSFTYNFRRSRSEFVVDYRLGARHYNRNSNLDVITHDLGISQIRQLSPHLTWKMNYRYSFTPDYAGSLLQDDLAREFSIINPLPSGPVGGTSPGATPVAPSLGATFVNPLPGGVSLLPGPVNPLGGVAAAGDGLQTVRSVRMTNHAATDLNYTLSSRTAIFFQAGFRRTWYEDSSLFGTDDYNLSLGTQYASSPRTNLGVSYQAGLNDLDAVLNRTFTQSIVVSFSRQLIPRTTLSITAGPMYTRTRSQEEIPLSPLLANLLGRPALYHEVSETRPSWMGSLGIVTQWRQFNPSFNYNRTVSSSSGLGGASLQESFSAGLSRQLGRRTSFSLRAVYSQSKLLGTLDPVQFRQRALSGTFTRQLSSGLDFEAFVNYSKVLKGVQSSYRAAQSQAGIRLQLHLPRVRPT